MKVEPSVVMNTSEFHATKLEAIKAYQSQFIENEKNQVVFDHLENENRYWGRRIGAQYGEPFICREAVGIHDANALLAL